MTSLPLLLLALPLSGCLFLDDINHPPVGALAAEHSGPVLKGTLVTLNPSASTDPDVVDRGLLTFRWFVDDIDVNTMDMPSLFKFNGDPGPSVRVGFCTAGSHHVAVVAFDRHHAQSMPAVASIDVTDAPPVIDRIDVGGNMSTCNDYVAGSAVTLVANVSDADEGACAPPDGPNKPERITYHWHVTGPNGSPGAISIVEGACGQRAASPGATDAPVEVGGSATADHACLLAGAPGTYTVELKVDDGARFNSKADVGTDVRPSRTVNLTMGPDRPACADGFDPALGTQILDRGASQTFNVTEVLDDQDGYPGTARFAWKLWRESDPVWRDVPGWALASYTLDSAQFKIDELVRLRVEVRDRVDRTPPTCDVKDDVCPLVHDFPNQICFDSTRINCEAWATWDVRFR